MLAYVYCGCFFFFKQKTAYEMRISDWSSDVCSSDLCDERGDVDRRERRGIAAAQDARWRASDDGARRDAVGRGAVHALCADRCRVYAGAAGDARRVDAPGAEGGARRPAPLSYRPV